MPFTIPAAIALSAGVGAASSTAGAFASQANNEKLLDKQMAFNREMYERQQKDARTWYEEIESPMAQRRAYEAAGYSPWAALNGGAAPSAPQSSVGGTDMPYQTGNPFQGLSDNVTRAMEMFRQSLNDKIARDKAQAEINSINLDNAEKAIQLKYDESNFTLDKLAHRASLSNGFDSGAAASFNNYINNPSKYELFGRAYDVIKFRKSILENEYQEALKDKTVTEKEKLEIGKKLDEFNLKAAPLMNSLEAALMRSQIRSNDVSTKYRALLGNQQFMMNDLNMMDFETSSFKRDIKSFHNPDDDISASSFLDYVLDFLPKPKKVVEHRRR